MSVRKLVQIDEELCDGCGLCVPSCAEGALQIIDGKARLLAEKLCDGLGACLGECPNGAITVEDQEADEFDEEAVKEHLAKQHEFETSSADSTPVTTMPIGGCPGSRVMQFDSEGSSQPATAPSGVIQSELRPQSELRQWPVQLHLVPPNAPYFQGADILVAADCTAFSVPDFHSRYLKNKALAVACPKLDQGMDVYLAKLVALIDQAEVNTITVLIMEVPCCGGLVQLVQEATSKAKRKVPVKKVVVGVRGEKLAESWV